MIGQPLATTTSFCALICFSRVSAEPRKGGGQGRLVRRLATIACALMRAVPPAFAQSDEWTPPTHHLFGLWNFTKYLDLGRCVIERQLSKYNDTKLTVRAEAAKSVYDFELRNFSWHSLKDGPLLLTAAFTNSTGEISNVWELSTTAVAKESGGPRIRWSIDRAENDDASFIEQLRHSHQLWFFKDAVPISKYDLSHSDEAVEAVERCRAELRAANDFDPFAS